MCLCLYSWSSDLVRGAFTKYGFAEGPYVSIFGQN